MKPGISYTNDAAGIPRYVHIDLQKFENSYLLEDLLDLLEIEARKNEETISLEEFNQYIDRKLKRYV